MDERSYNQEPAFKDKEYTECERCDGDGWICDNEDPICKITCPRCNGEGQIEITND